MIQLSFNTASGKHCCNAMYYAINIDKVLGFNTASGKHCCNAIAEEPIQIAMKLVSIPQAVSTVAT